jgi:integration host factor subunit alpha
MSKSESKDAVETLFEIVKERLEDGEEVKISGFGKFEVKEKKRRRGRNPRTGEDMTLRERRILVFRTSPVLREKINHK